MCRRGCGCIIAFIIGLTSIAILVFIAAFLGRELAPTTSPGVLALTLLLAAAPPAIIGLLIANAIGKHIAPENYN